MADLSVLIRLHEHELDEKRRVLAVLYSELALTEQQRRALEKAFDQEKTRMAKTPDVHFTFSHYAESVKKMRESFLDAEAELERRIEQAKDSMMESFSELKKYEMTQAERDRIEAEERKVKEALELDAIGLESFRRKSDES